MPILGTFVLELLAVQSLLPSKIADDLFLLFSFEINMRNWLEKLTGAAYFTLAPGGTLPRYATVTMMMIIIYKNRDYNLQVTTTL